MKIRFPKHSTLFLTLACVSLAQGNHQLAGEPVLGKAGGHGAARAKDITVKGVSALLSPCPLHNQLEYSAL